VSRGISPRW